MKYPHPINLIPVVWALRPGMAGEASVDTTRRPLAWIWAHRLIDFLRLKLLM